mgnify:FL=1
MNYLKKIGKYFLSSLISILILSFLLSFLYYFNVISSSIYNIFKMIIIVLPLFINSLLLGKESSKYGLMEGIKLGALFLVFILVLQAITKTSINIKSFIYYVIILLTTGLGAVIGINNQEKKNKN